MQAVILAGGNPTRVYPPSFGVPKPMLPLFDRPVMEHTIRLLAKHGINDIIVALSGSIPQIPAYFGNGARWGVRIRYSVEDAPLGTAGALRRLKSMIEGTFVVVSADTVTDADLRSAIGFHRSASAVATLLVCSVADTSDYGLVRMNEKGRVAGLIEKPLCDEASGGIVSAGIYVMEPEVLSSIPDSQPRDLSLHTLPGMLNNGEPVYAFPIAGYWCDVGNTTQYTMVHFDALQGKLRLDLPAVHVGDGIWLGEGTDIHPSASICSPAFIGRGSCVRRNATLAGCVVLGENVLVDEGAQISRSVIGASSLVGRNTRIADCILSGSHDLTGSETLSDRVLITADEWALEAGTPRSGSYPGASGHRRYSTDHIRRPAA